ncbi:cupin domain-containing protein [Paenibacillus brasilensis]|uniref:Quercetin dioxygenase-like cupin family protein n=1 Tax=Paenibacillus brasilensis TaxID=128574 RepID=A0ABU0KTR6_9BACL|nr:cupin domain-containing protein [Paenibacillus brasilensis]MDQ0492828.1 quercetin dioxygenase-like cupin family protein [Paenibacillus brasilensis]
MIIKRNQVPFSVPFENLERRVLAYNDKIMLVEHVMAAGSVFPAHSHPHEQLAYISKGRLKILCNEQEYIVEAGDSFAVPGNVVHQVIALEESIALDFFAPAREDYIAEVKEHFHDSVE